MQEKLFPKHHLDSFPTVLHMQNNWWYILKSGKQSDEVISCLKSILGPETTRKFESCEQQYQIIDDKYAI